MSLRNKIFFALLIITLPMVIVAFQNIKTIENFIRNSPGFSDQAGVIMEELLFIESKIEKLGMSLASNVPGRASHHSSSLSEIRTSFSIVENLLSAQATGYPEIEAIRKSLSRFEQMIERCHSSCKEESHTIQREQALFDENVESLIRKTLAIITGDYKDLKEKIREGNVRGEWSLLALLILLLGGSYFLALGLTHRIVSLQVATQGVLKGDLFVPLPPPSHDEIGELISAFEGMRANLTNSMVTRRYLETLLNELGEGVIVTNQDGEIEVANPAASDLLDGAYEKEKGSRYEIRAHGTFTLPTEQRHIAIITRDGEERLITITSAPLLNDTESLVGYVHGIKDITEKVALEKNLASHRERLARGERIMALGTLGAIVAHKLSQPISSTRLFLQQSLRELEKLKLSGDLKEILSEALGEISRISDTVTKMMRSERNLEQTRTKISSVDAVSSIQSVTQSMFDACARRGAELTTNLPFHPVIVGCKKIEFEELIYCLITNALQASVPERKTEINVSLVFSNDSARISISDNGSGISEQSIDSIFDCFFTTKSEENGTGLGLAIVRHIVESHGGTVRVSSEVDVGSTFILELPLSHGESYAETHDSVHC